MTCTVCPTAVPTRSNKLSNVFLALDAHLFSESPNDHAASLGGSLTHTIAKFFGGDYEEVNLGQFEVFELDPVSSDDALSSQPRRVVGIARFRKLIWTGATIARGLALQSGSGAIMQVEAKYF